MRNVPVVQTVIILNLPSGRLLQVVCNANLLNKKVSPKTRGKAKAAQTSYCKIKSIIAFQTNLGSDPLYS